MRYQGRLENNTKIFLKSGVLKIWTQFIVHLKKDPMEDRCKQHLLYGTTEDGEFVKKIYRQSTSESNVFHGVPYWEERSTSIDIYHLQWWIFCTKLSKVFT